MVLIRDLTPQEDLVAKCLDELGIRYAQQVDVGNYVVDFLVEDVIILEVDGYYGHFNQRDRMRDNNLLTLGDGRFEKIVHIKGQTKPDIMDELQDNLIG